jgi:hypothetical protein
LEQYKLRHEQELRQRERRIVSLKESLHDLKETMSRLRVSQGIMTRHATSAVNDRKGL